MIARAKQSTRIRPDEGKQKFEQLLPAIRDSARFAFRKLPPSERDEAIGEVVANAFCAFRRLVDLGKIDIAYASPLARFAIAQYRSGRRVGTSRNHEDVLASAERGHGRWMVLSLSHRDGDAGDWHVALADGRRWSVPDQAAFRVDFPAWLRSLSQRDRQLIKFLSIGNRTCDAAERFGVTAGRISQLRSHWQAAWEAFHALPKDHRVSALPSAEVAFSGRI